MIRALFLVALLVACSPDVVTVTCQFKNMTDKFTTTKSEAEAYGKMITVHKGNRTFMFLRSGLSACEVVDETP